MQLFIVVFITVFAAFVACDDERNMKGNGPGSGNWVVVSPESQGLNTSLLEAAELRVLERVPRRLCYLVVKNGYIVYEKYYNGWTESSVKNGWSTTKSHCSTLFGIATQQGWANASDFIADRNGNDTRSCNPQAQFIHALTMTGESEDLDIPDFRYDTAGLRCLDSISDFIAANNPEGLTTEEFKDKYWQNPLAWEHSRWLSNPNGQLMCGFSSIVSCRDMARSAQLWANEGLWDGEQIVNRNHILTGRTFVFPDSRPPVGLGYGYTVWRHRDDPVDPDVHAFIGMFSQCAHISKVHEAIVVSMGVGDLIGGRCFWAWTETRDAVISNDFDDFLISQLSVDKDSEEYKAKEEETIQYLEEHLISREDIFDIYKVMLNDPQSFSSEEIEIVNHYVTNTHTVSTN